MYINGVWQNPYLTDMAIAFTPHTLKSSSKTVQFKLPSNTWLSNIKNQISSIQLDANNGAGYQTITINQYLTLEFYENKTYDLDFKITRTNGSVYYSHSKFAIHDPTLESVEKAAIINNDQTKVYIYDETMENGLYRGATLTIRRGPDPNNITRPFIVVEGFDAGHITDPADFDGDTSINSFENDVDFAGFTFRNSIFGNNPQYDLIYIDWKQGTADMRDNSRVLELALDWINENKVGPEPNVLFGQSMGGVIGRYTLAGMEQEDPNFDPNNAAATSPHDVRLFVAHDSPMQGANIPLSLEHFTRHVQNEYVNTPIAYIFGEVILPVGFDLASQIAAGINNNWLFDANLTVDPFVSPGELLSIQDTPAARQLNYWSLPNSSQTPTQNFYNIWQNELNSFGYPKASRNIAISNGNECSDGHGFNAGDILFKIDDVNEPTLFGELFRYITTAAIGIARGDIGLIGLGLIPGRTNWSFNFDIHSFPELGSQEKIYYGRISYEKKVLWIGPRIRHTLTSKSFNSPPEALPLGTFAGGYFDVNPFKCGNNSDGVFVCVQDFILNLPDAAPSIQVLHRQFGFIPTISALDVKKVNGSGVSNEDYFKTFSGGMPQDAGLISEFDNFIVDFQPNNSGNKTINTADPNNAFNSNNEHISFQTRNGNWLADELNANVPGNNFPVLDDCSWSCDLFTEEIQGPDVVCDSEVFTVVNGPANYNWTSLTNGLVVTNVNNNQATFTRQNDFNGYATIQVTNNAATCGVNNPNPVFTKIVYVGIPEIDNAFITELDPSTFLPLSTSNNSCELTALRIDGVPRYDLVDEVEMRKPATSIAQWDADQRTGRDNKVGIYPDCNELFVFEVRMRNDCGWSEWKEVRYNLDDCNTDCTNGNSGNSGMSENFIISPVPADTDITISFNVNPTWTFTPTQCYTGLTDENGNTLCDYHIVVEMYDLSDLR
jgi:hypothetical protein